MGNWRWSSGFVKKLKQKWFILLSKRCWREATMLKQFAFLCVSCFRNKNHPALESSWDTWKSFVPFKLHLSAAAVFISPLKVKLIRRRQIHEFLIPVIKKGRRRKEWRLRGCGLGWVHFKLFSCNVVVFYFLSWIESVYEKIFNPNSNLMAKTTFTNWISGSAREYWKRNTWRWITNIDCWIRNLFNSHFFPFLENRPTSNYW